MSEEEEQRYNALLERVNSNSAAKKRVGLWQILTPVISFFAAVTITLTCVFTLKPPSNFVYNYENIESQQTTYSEMQADINYFDLSVIEPYESEIKNYYDTLSSDKLYYTCKAEFELNTLSLVIVINEKYDYKFELKDEPESKQLADYTVTYMSESSRGKPEITYKGYIKVQTETVYFDYVQIPALGDEAFFESIQQIIQIKK